MKRMIPLLALGLLLSACTIRLDAAVTINEDNSGQFSVFVGLDKEFRQLAEQNGGSDLSFTDSLKDVPPGWEVADVTDGDFQGVRISTDFKSLADLESKVQQLRDSGDAAASPSFLTDFGLTREGDEFRFSVDLQGIGQGLTEGLGGGGGEDLLQGMDPTELFSNLFQIRFLLTLPGKIGENNADEVNGNTLIWNIDLTDEGKTLNAVSSTGGSSRSVLYLIGGIALLVVLGAAVIATRRRREEASVNAVLSQPAPADAAPLVDGDRRGGSAPTVEDDATGSSPAGGDEPVG